MSAKKSKKKSGTKKKAGARATATAAERAARSEIKQGVKHLERSIGEIKKGLRKTEKVIEADARARIRSLRRDANTQLSVLKQKQREAKAR